jgi:hypothetical protein
VRSLFNLFTLRSTSSVFDVVSKSPAAVKRTCRGGCFPRLGAAEGFDVAAAEGFEVAGDGVWEGSDVGGIAGASGLQAANTRPTQSSESPAHSLTIEG